MNRRYLQLQHSQLHGNRLESANCNFTKFREKFSFRLYSNKYRHQSYDWKIQSLCSTKITLRSIYDIYKAFYFLYVAYLITHHTHSLDYRTRWGRHGRECDHMTWQPTLSINMKRKTLYDVKCHVLRLVWLISIFEATIIHVDCISSTCIKPLFVPPNPIPSPLCLKLWTVVNHNMM